MASSKDGYLCKTDDAWLHYHVHQRDSARTVVYYRKPYNTPFNRFPTAGPIFGCTIVDSVVQLCMRGTFRSHKFLTVADAWSKYGDALGAADLDDWNEQANRVLHGTGGDELSITVIDNFRFLIPPISLELLSFQVTPQTLQVGRAINEHQIAELDGLIPNATASQNAIDIEVPDTSRVETTTYRILRDTRLAIEIKQLHNYRCQICGETIELPNGERYAEAHHIQPLGSPHDGPDIAGNIIVLCPNHYAMCDYSAIHLSINDLRSHPQHSIDPEFIEYHNRFADAATMTAT